MIHGIGGTLRDFDPIVGRLSRNYRILRFDLRGFGKSEKTREPYNPAVWADDLLAALSKLKVRRAVMVGHSMGGRIVCMFAAKYPRSTSGLVTLNSTAWGSNPDGARKLQESIEDAHDKGMSVFLRSAPWLRLKIKHPRYSKLVHDETLANDVESYVNAARSVIADFTGRPTPSYLKRISCPALIVVGDRDSAPLEGALGVHRAISNSYLAVIPDCGHYSFYEQPRTLTTILVEFLKGIK